jgi:murein tripeptide amidase MpaA
MITSMRSLKYLFLILFLSTSCSQNTQWKGQDPIKKVDTHTVPIQLQYKGIFDMGSGVYLSNDFIGARLNGAARTNDTLISILITPENEKINPSPWYAFKIWSEQEQDISLNFIYPENVGHRYYPKLSHDGLVWERLDSNAYHIDMGTTIEGQNFPKNMQMKIHIGPDTLFVSAQELNTSKELGIWLSHLDTLPFVSLDTIGYSRQGRPLQLLKIGANDDQRMLFILSRQHPPEVTGYLAMQAFVETLCSTSELAEDFRKEYSVYVLPMANPDGVDNGHWRHNAGGVDLNRDWADFNQPETRAIRDFMKEKVAESGGKFYFAMDFHSTYEDIYYTEDPVAEGNMPGLIPKLITESGAAFDNYEPNIKSGLDSDARVSSTSYFFYEFGAESFTYEIGDNTDRDFVLEKGEVTAETLMELLIN